MPRTKVSNEAALRQVVSDDGRRVCSIIKAADSLFRFVEDTEVYEADDPPPFWHWIETHRSGIYETIEKAEVEALNTLPWLRAQITR